MYKYTFTSDVNIKTPFGITDFNSIRKEITQTAECITNKSTYPNGFVIEMKQFADRIEVASSHELIDNGDGSLSVKI
ncbi:hypothetical protein [Turicibacter sanguinis]|uniref:hypothetical protein n=1 Tax=Turicibacter sanguinis TaxID=154288 RepID=UPI0021D4FB4A|nr:hypothetical protein [Turicibacter sanguinis]MCU7201364.1 hypothetical protein [Turicibacter sanguinis]